MRLTLGATLFLTVSLSLIVPGAHAQATPSQSFDVDSEEVALARKLLVATNSAALFVHTLKTSIPGQRAAAPELPMAFWDTLLVRAESQSDSLLARLIPAYTETYTVEELKGLLQFYESPLGRRMVELQPTVVSKSMAIGQQWGMELGFAVAQDFIRAGRLTPDPR